MANKYKLVKIIETYPDKGGKVRMVKLTYKKRDKRVKLNKIFKGLWLRNELEYNGSS